MASSDNCTTITNLNNSTLMLAAHQLQISNNLTTAELIQKILESPQGTSSGNHIESLINNRKIDDSSISSLVQTYRDSINSDSMNNQYYECSLDSNHEPEITLLVDDENSVPNAQFARNVPSIKQEKQILILKGKADMESLPNGGGRNACDSMKDHLTLFSNQNGGLDMNSDLYNESSNFSQSNNAGASLVGMKKNHSMNKTQKRLKIKPSKIVESSVQSDSSSKAYSSNSPIFTSNS